MSKKVHLVVIDPQNDFCDQTKGTLAVKGADADMQRLAEMIRRLSGKVDDIHVTLDSHHTVHVAHPLYWRNKRGEHPAPFTIITSQDVKDGVWTPYRPSWGKRAKEYVETLERNGKYPLCIWPPHCLIGSWGHGVFPALYDALCEWERQEFAAVDYVTKGSNYHTEHYSAITADVPDPDDHTTSLNTDFLNTVIQADVILLAGEAGSHCLANTARDADTYFADSSFVKKLVLLTDATSPVPGFEHLQEQFIKDMTAKGMQVSTTKEFLA